MRMILFYLSVILELISFAILIYIILTIQKIDKKEEKYILIYSNHKKPYIEIKQYIDKKLTQTKIYPINNYELENGVIVNIELMANKIKEDFNNIQNLDIYLNIKEMFKTTISLPKIRNANTMYNKELKENYKQIIKEYNTYKIQYKHKLGNIYDTYFIPNTIIDSIKKLNYLLKIKKYKIDLYGKYIFNNIKMDNKGNFSVIYKNEENILLLNIYNNNLTTIYNFNSNDKEEIIKEYQLIISKHEFEFEKEKIDYILTNEQIEINIPIKMMENII